MNALKDMILSCKPPSNVNFLYNLVYQHNYFNLYPCLFLCYYVFISMGHIYGSIKLQLQETQDKTRHNIRKGPTAPREVEKVNLPTKMKADDIGCSGSAE